MFQSQRPSSLPTTARWRFSSLKRIADSKASSWRSMRRDIAMPSTTSRLAARSVAARSAIAV
jgi:hypothetical protein